MKECCHLQPVSISNSEIIQFLKVVIWKLSSSKQHFHCTKTWTYPVWSLFHELLASFSCRFRCVQHFNQLLILLIHISLKFDPVGVGFGFWEWLNERGAALVFVKQSGNRNKWIKFILIYNEQILSAIINLACMQQYFVYPKKLRMIKFIPGICYLMRKVMLIQDHQVALFLNLSFWSLLLKWRSNTICILLQRPHMDPPNYAPLKTTKSMTTMSSG